MENKILIAEYPTTEIDFARIRITLWHPHLKRSVSSEMHIDDKMLEDFESLTMPEHIRRLYEVNPDRALFLHYDWTQKRERAKNMIDIIAKNMAQYLAVELEKAFNGR